MKNKYRPDTEARTGPPYNPAEPAERDILRNLDIFNNVVSHAYLSQLSECQVVPKGSAEKARMRWVHITKIVKDKDVFFPDQLSMLYTALHSCAKNVVLVLEKRQNAAAQLYLGVRDFDGALQQSGETLRGALTGYLPGVESQPCKGPEANPDEAFVASFSGVASLRDDKKQQFIQGLERLLDSSTAVPAFTAYFVADNVPDVMARQMISAFATLHTQLQPLGEAQLAFNESQTDTLSRSLTRSLSQSITDTLSETVTKSEGTSSSVSTSHTEGTSKTKGHSMGVAVGGMVAGIGGGANYSHNWSKTTNESDTATDQQGTNRSRSQAGGKSQARGEVRGESTQEGGSRGITTGSSRQITLRNRAVKCMLDTLDKQMERLEQGRPFGLWSVATYFTAPTRTTALKLANIYRGTVVGEKSNLENSAVNVWEKEPSRQIMPYLSDSASPRFLYRGINVSAGSVVTSEEMAIHLSLPQSSVPGILVRQEKTFGRNVALAPGSSGGPRLRLGCVRHLGQDDACQEVSLDIGDLAKHVFVTGSTGSGKSNTVYRLLDGLLQEGLKALVIEPAKGEYRHVFGPREGFAVYGTNPELTRLLKINPFAFPRGIRVEEHVDRLVEIFNVCWPMYAAMPAVLKESILGAYRACGWDLRRSRNPYGLFPTFADVVSQLHRVIESSAYSADTKGDYIGSLETRLRSLTNGVYSQIFTGAGALEPAALFDDNAIVDLSRLGSSETRSLLMGLLVLMLSEHRMTQAQEGACGGMNQPLRHVTVLEEAHNLLRRTSKEQSQEGANMVGKSVEMISNAIAEMRTYGEGFVIVDQSPTSVDEAAIKNTNTKIVMSLYAEEDRRTAGGALGLDDEHKREISNFPTGVALVYQNQWQEPVLTHIDRYRVSGRAPIAPEGRPETEDSKPSERVIEFILGTIGKGGFDSPALCSDVQRAAIPGWVKYQLLKALDELASKGTANTESLRGNVLWHYLGLGTEIEEIFKRNTCTPAEIVPQLNSLLLGELELQSEELRCAVMASLMNTAAAQSPELDHLCNLAVREAKKLKLLKPWL